MGQPNAAELCREIVDYWFASIDDATPLDREQEPFRTCFARWYGKQPAIDDEIRSRFEPALRAVSEDGARWEAIVDEWRAVPSGLLPLVILLDQFPRNMYRDSPRMYAHDALALAAATLAIREYETAPLPLVRRMFLYLPWMHAENATLQQAMVARFEELAELAVGRSPHNRGFFEFALGYARRHLAIVDRFGRFPHRNAILGRQSMPEEIEFLKGADSSF